MEVEEDVTGMELFEYTKDCGTTEADDVQVDDTMVDRIVDKDSAEATARIEAKVVIGAKYFIVYVCICRCGID